MSTELTIFKIDFDDNYRQHGHKIIYTQIGNCIYNNTDFQVAIEETSRQKYWHLDGECGFIGELLGEDIKALIKLTKYTKTEPKNAELILNNLESESFYRVSVSY